VLVQALRAKTFSLPKFNYCNRLRSMALVLIAGLTDGCCGASDADQKLAEFRIDVLVAADDEVFHVLDGFQHRPSFIHGLGRHPWAVAVVYTIVTTLENGPEPLLELLGRPVFSKMSEGDGRHGTLRTVGPAGPFGHSAYRSCSLL